MLPSTCHAMRRDHQDQLENAGKIANDKPSPSYQRRWRSQCGRSQCGRSRRHAPGEIIARCQLILRIPSQNESDHPGHSPQFDISRINEMGRSPRTSPQATPLSKLANNRTRCSSRNRQGVLSHHALPLLRTVLNLLALDLLPSVFRERRRDTTVNLPSDFISRTSSHRRRSPLPKLHLSFENLFLSLSRGLPSPSRSASNLEGRALFFS